MFQCIKKYIFLQTSFRIYILLDVILFVLSLQLFFPIPWVVYKNCFVVHNSRDFLRLDYEINQIRQSMALMFSHLRCRKSRTNCRNCPLWYKGGILKASYNQRSKHLDDTDTAFNFALLPANSFVLQNIPLMLLDKSL